MDVLTLLGCVGFIFRFGHKVTGLVFLWWRKEYRLDRMRIHLGTRQGRSVLLGKTHVLLAALCALYVIPFTRSAAYMALAVFLISLGAMNLRSIRRWHIPPISPKVIALFVFFCAFVFMTARLLPTPLLLSFVIADLLLFPVSLVAVTALGFPTRLFHALKIRQAEARLSAHKKMMVLGITGSYGKTSVKEYLSVILSSAYKTIKTDASKNSPIGISEVVLAKLRDEHEVFVVEMGAYRPGEIAEMTRMVSPEIGILTAINPQHQDLFGSIETTMKAKYELAAGLTGKKIFIANLDSSNTRRMAGWAKRDGREVWGWTQKGEKRERNSIAAHIFMVSRIRADMSGVTFDCRYGKQKKRIHAPVLGEHQAGNIVAAVAGAVACGMDFAAAAAAAAHIRPAKQVMEVMPGINGSLFIDDTFNNNPDAAAAAMRFIGSQPGRKFVVFQPMVELGAFAERSHVDAGRVAAENCDAILLTNNNFFTPFAQGVRSVSKSIPLKVESPAGIAMYIRSTVKKGDTVLFKGKDAEHALRLLV